jgi:hypothetical protein
MVITANNNLVQPTSHKVVIPFYIYAGLSFLTATILLSFSGKFFTGHFFHPYILAITHAMALGWGTMIILGASHQLVPVLIEAKLHSHTLAYVSFILAATGIPLLVYAFFRFQWDWVAQTGGMLINAAILSFLINLAMSILNSKKENVHAIFVFTATAWLLVTTLMGLLLIFNFTLSILPEDSLHYLSLHAHAGIVGWFLLLVIGVGSRLIPMFLISKYDNPKKLWLIYYLINGALIFFIIFFFSRSAPILMLFPLAALFLALILFAGYCYKAYHLRIRKQVDEQVKISLLSVAMMALPVALLLILIFFIAFSVSNSQLVMAYGFSIFFGWLTAIILGMTFKTLPFIVWNKIYHKTASLGKTPNPKDLFGQTVFNSMGISYLAGFCLFVSAIFISSVFMLQLGSALLLLAALLYNYNLLKMLLHKANIK